MFFGLMIKNWCEGSKRCGYSNLNIKRTFGFGFLLKMSFTCSKTLVCYSDFQT